MSKTSRDKGKRGELELAHFLEDRGIEARRTQQFSGSNGTSDVLTPDLPIHWEVKRTECLRLMEALNQAVHDCEPGKTPVVAWRKNRGEWVAILRLADLLDSVQGGAR